MPLLGKTGAFAKIIRGSEMAAQQSTPGSSKKRKLGGRAVETGVDRMLVSGAESDLRYITRELESKPKVLAEVARLLRDGELEKAIARKETVAVQAPIGVSRALLKHSFGESQCVVWSDRIGGVVCIRPPSDGTAYEGVLCTLVFRSAPPPCSTKLTPVS